nr:MAG TPA: hypothetical protein [Caudoviricetes sp.]
MKLSIDIIRDTRYYNIAIRKSRIFYIRRDIFACEY